MIIIGFVTLLALDKFPADTLSITLMVMLIVGNFVSPQEGISGMSNEAAVTVLALMILTVGLETTGVISSLGRYLKTLLKGRDWKIVLILMLAVGFASAFIVTTAVVIVFMRIVIRLSKTMPLSLSSLLIPLSFAGILGGSCTLLGTSTNLLVSAIATDHGLPPFEVFEFTHIGVVFFVVGVLYMTFIGRKFIVKREDEEEEEDLTSEYAIQGYLAEVFIGENSNLIGQKIKETPLFIDREIDLLEIKKRDEKPHFPSEEEILKSGDILLLKGSIEKIAGLRMNNNLTMLTGQSENLDQRLNTDDMTLCEVIVRPISRLVGKTLDKVSIRRDYNAIPLAVRKKQKYFKTNLEELTIEAGDTILMEVRRANFKRFYNLPEFVVLQEYEELYMRTGKRYLAGAIMLLVILTASLGIVSILVSALAGCVLMFLTGCMDLQKAYRRVDWSVYFLLAGMIPLGTAMDNTGASQLIAEQFVFVLSGYSGPVLVGSLFLISMMFSAVITNNATAIMIAPIAISIAFEMNLDPRPILFTVMFASNMSFISPVGYQTNALVFGPGRYRLLDYVKAGGGLSLIIWIIASFLISAYYF